VRAWLCFHSAYVLVNSGYGCLSPTRSILFTFCVRMESCNIEEIFLQKCMLLYIRYIYLFCCFYYFASLCRHIPFLTKLTYAYLMQLKVKLRRFICVWPNPFRVSQDSHHPTKSPSIVQIIPSRNYTVCLFPANISHECNLQKLLQMKSSVETNSQFSYLLLQPNGILGCKSLKTISEGAHRMQNNSVLRWLLI